MSTEPAGRAPQTLPRLFLFDVAWQVARKASSVREFCYMMAPGQDYYHRLVAGEIFLQRGDEKVCLPCAARRGLLSSDPMVLREPMAGINLAIDQLLDGFDVVVREDLGPPR